MIQTDLDNETLFFLLTFIDLLLILAAWRFGRVWVYVTIAVNIILVSTFGQLLIKIFGYITNATNVCYAAIFLASNILNEHLGTREAYKSVWLGFLGLFIFVLTGQLILDFTPAHGGLVSDAMTALFAGAPRVAAASFFAYAIAQNFAVWCYDYLRKLTKSRHLWLRHNISAISGQFIDSVIFFGLAFGGLVGNDELIGIILTGWLVKVIVTVIETPFLYASAWIVGKPFAPRT